MTRSHSHSSGATKQDKHHQRNGMKDVRGLSKKNGGGKSNWGNYDMEEDYIEDIEAEVQFAEKYLVEPSSHVQLVDSLESIKE